MALFLACGLAPLASAQTRTLRIVTYNIEADTGTTTPLPGLIAPSGGSVTNGGVLEGIGEEIVGSDAAQPIDILALEETTSNTTTVTPIVNGLNAYYNTPGMYAMSTYQATESGGSPTSGNGPNALVYNTTTVQLVASVPVDPPGGTSKLGSSSGEYREVMRYEFAPAGVTTNAANVFFIYVSHYKADTGTQNATYRLGEAQIIRTNEADFLPANARVLYVGDYNPDNGSGEPGYQTIISNTAPNGIVQGGGIDPMNLSGATNLNWSNGSLIGQNTDASTSLEYRDDLQVMTTNVYYGAPGGLAYVPGTYHVFGNNGTTAFGSSVGSGNSALTNLVSSASYPYQYISAAQLYTDLTTASDHLPVVADYTIPISAPSMAVSPTSAFSSTGTQGGPFSPSSQTYTLTNGGSGSLNWTATNTANWLTLSANGGTLAAGVSTNITVSVNANANSLAVNTYSDTVGFTNTSNGTGNTTRAVSLTVNPTPAQLAAGPSSGFSSSGYVGGPFSPSSQSYGLTNVGGTTMSWTASITATWLSLSATSGTLAAGASTNITVSVNANANGLAVNTYSDTVGFTNTSNGAGNTARAVSLTVNPTPAQLAVGPSSEFTSSGYVGGPFSPSSQTYGLTNVGGATLSWTASITANWLTLSATSGTLAAGASTNVIVSINANANGLAVNTYADTVSFTNASNGVGNMTEPVSLTVNPTPAQLAVGPTSEFTSSGYVGGPFSPSSQTYGLTNMGGTTLSWTATITANWLSLSAIGGTLAAGASTNITVSVNANANGLAVNTYSDTVGFTNTGNGAGNTARAVSLTVNPTPAQLAVGPSSGFSSSGYVGGPFSPSDQTYSLTNLGGTTLDWTASITANWLSLSATSGTLAPGASTNVTLSVNANADALAADTYSDTLAFTNADNGVGNTTAPVSLTVSPLPAQLAVGPLSGFASSGVVGGPFSPSSQTYSLTNAGGTTLSWTASITADWLTLSATSGTLAPGDTTNVTVSVNENAQGLAVSAYSDTVSFTNTSNGIGNTTAAVSLLVLAPTAQLSVGPASGLSSSGYVGGPFTPSSQTYSLTNLGATALDWTASVTADWLTLSATNGTLAAGTSTNVTLSINSDAASLGANTYSDMITFTNVSNDLGDTNWPVSLTITALTPFQSWQVFYFGSTTNPAAAPDADPDHDGMSNWAEFLAGTDPTNSASVFRITGIARQGNDLRITWTMGSGKTNVLQEADGLGGANNFADVFTVLTVGSTTNYLDTGAATNAAARYYRIRLGP
jgi:hypothetical protein